MAIKVENEDYSVFNWLNSPTVTLGTPLEDRLGLPKQNLSSPKVSIAELHSKDVVKKR